MRWSRPTRPRSGRATAPRWSRRPGPIRPSANGSWRTRPPPSPRSASPAARASTWWRSRTRRTSTTWSSAPCAPATPGRCSACRRSGTSRRPTARAPSSIRAASLPSSASTLPKPTRIRVWDSTAEVRYLVVPMRPDGTEGWSEEALADLVTRDSMIGTGLGARPRIGGSLMNGAQDLGGMMGFGRIEPEPDEPVPRRLGAARARADARHGRDRPVDDRHEPAARESLHPADYLSSSYYEIWTKGLEKLVLRQGLVDARTSSRPAMRSARRSRSRGCSRPRRCRRRSPRAARATGRHRRRRASPSATGS